MNGLTKVFIGLFWIGCGLYSLINVNVDSTIGASASGFAIGVMITVGAIITITGVEKMQKGE